MGHESVDIEIILYYKLNSFYLCRQKSSYSHGQVYYYVNQHIWYIVRVVEKSRGLS